MSKPMSFDEFVEEWIERNSDMCQCHTTSMPPCGFCEGGYLDQAKAEYEDYLEEFEEEE